MSDVGFDFELLAELTETSGVPGYEDRVREIVRRELEGRVDEVQTDDVGNVVGTVHGDADYEVVVAAHMDES
jgi:endoglucanase